MARVNSLLNEPTISDSIPTMQTATLDELHADPYRLDRSIDAGEPIEVFRDGHRVGRFVPEAPRNAEVPLQWPDFRARAKAIFGDRVMTQQEFDELRAYEDGEASE